MPPDAAEPYALQIAGEWRRARASSGQSSAVPTRPRLRSRTPTTRKPCAKPSKSCSGWARDRRRRSSRAGCASAARTGCRADRAAETRQNPAGLTARELEILALVAQGLRNAEIADAAVSLPEDGRPPRLGDPAQARRAHAWRGRGDRPA